MDIIDSHAHLWMDHYNSDERELVIERARLANISIIDIGGGSYMEGNEKTVLLSEKYEHVYSTLGLHPHDADKVLHYDYKKIEVLLKMAKKVVAIGEIGLDYYRNYASRENQIRIFEYQLAMADSLNLPVVVHVRDAHADAITILRKNRVKRSGVIHCYSGSAENVREYNDLGYYISIPGSVTFKKNDKLSVLKIIAQDRLLVETDSPFLTPEPLRGQRNEPSYIIHTIRKMAEILGLSFLDVCELTKNNAERLFDIKI